MSDLERKFHEEWLGLAQPVDGLVVSVPVLTEAQVMERQPPSFQERFLRHVPEDAQPARGKRRATAPRSLAALAPFLEDILGWTPDLYDTGAAIPDDLSLYVPEGQQTLRPTLALRKVVPPRTTTPAADATPASISGERYVALVWEVPKEIELDKPETLTGPWAYPAAAKFDRLLRACRVPIGLVTNRRVLRLVYAPHGESSGSITFRFDDLATVGGRPLLDAMVALLSAHRFFGAATEHQLPALVRASRDRQANVTNELAEQVFEALNLLLRGFEGASERDGNRLLADALARGDDHVYGGLLTVLLRLVFVLYAEDQGLLPVEQPLYAKNLSLLGLHAELQSDAGRYPDSMARRFGAYGRLVSLFRAIFFGARHGGLALPPREGDLFHPDRYPFLEGRSAEHTPTPEERARLRVPSIDDETILAVLQKLLFLGGQRLSYRALDVEQIGSVYERLMGYRVERRTADSVCVKPSAVWVSAEDLTAVAAGRRAKWLQDETGLAKARAEKLAKAVNDAEDDVAILAALEPEREKGTEVARAGRLVIQPGPERRRTSSHYTPRSLTAPIVRRTLEPLLAAMGDVPTSARILNLRVCDPAMGSGAFLVEACRFLADQLVAAWTREGDTHAVGNAAQDAVLEARRLVAQRCLYGVDKNPFAVSLAKLSLWLVTLAKDLPFTFLDHALRHGDSLVGLSFEQITGFHWRPEQQVSFAEKKLKAVLELAVKSRQRIHELAADPSPEAQRAKVVEMRDAEETLRDVRLLGDLVVGAFFAAAKDRDRERERVRRLKLVEEWLDGDESDPPAELLRMQAELLERLPTFHWMAEFPEVFWFKRPDPLDHDREGGEAWMDAFVGNPPFLGGKRISTEFGVEYAEFINALHTGSMNADIVAHFFRRTESLLGTSGTIGLVATNSIAQGETRELGLQDLLRRRLVIYDAVRTMLWPGEASVAVSLVTLAKGTTTRAVVLHLDGQRVVAINSRLRPTPERTDPNPLSTNTNLTFQGCIIIGSGFTLTPAEATHLLNKSGRNKAILKPYLGGDEINTSPDTGFERWAIDFGNIDLHEAEAWPDLLEIVRERVKPERDRNNRTSYRERWWQFGERQSTLFDAIRTMPRCLVNSQVSKHLVFAWQPTDRLFSNALYVHLTSASTTFAVLQSRTHETWARLLSGSLEDRLRYNPTACFDTFPFPAPDPCTVIPALESMGERLYTARAAYMVDTQQGLTQTYNRLMDPTCDEPRILELRRLHEELDRAVLDAYGWSHIAVPPFCPKTDTDKAALEAFEDEVIDGLFVLNAERAAEEARAVPSTKKVTEKKPKKAPTTAVPSTAISVVRDLFAPPPTGPVRGAPSSTAEPAPSPSLPALPAMPTMTPTLAAREEAILLVIALLRASGGTMRELDLARAFAIRKHPELIEPPKGLGTKVKSWSSRIRQRPPHPTFRATVDGVMPSGWVTQAVDGSQQAVRSIGAAAPPHTHEWYEFEALLLLHLIAPMTDASYALFDVSKELAA